MLGCGKEDWYGRLVPDTARRAFEAAAVEPGDIDVVECHDAAAPGELILCEELQLCPPGEAVKILREGATRIGGRLPVNPSGGLEAVGVVAARYSHNGESTRTGRCHHGPWPTAKSGSRAGSLVRAWCWRSTARRVGWAMVNTRAVGQPSRSCRNRSRCTSLWTLSWRTVNPR